MSSNIRVQRICEHCENEFTAKTSVTRFCSPVCNKRAYKLKLKTEKVLRSNRQTTKKKIAPIEELNNKEFLTVKEVATLLSCSVRSAYYYVNSGSIKGVNLGKRMIRVKRAELEKVFV